MQRSAAGTIFHPTSTSLHIPLPLSLSPPPTLICLSSFRKRERELELDVKETEKQLATYTPESVGVVQFRCGPLVDELPLARSPSTLLLPYLVISFLQLRGLDVHIRLQAQVHTHTYIHGPNIAEKPAAIVASIIAWPAREVTFDATIRSGEPERAAAGSLLSLSRGPLSLAASASAVSACSPFSFSRG